MKLCGMDGCDDEAISEVKVEIDLRTWDHGKNGDQSCLIDGWLGLCDGHKRVLESDATDQGQRISDHS